MTREPGFVQGKHYTEYVESVRALKRAGHFQEAEELLLKLVDATEEEGRVRNWGAAPWYYEQLAIIYRKQGNYSAEVAILERYASQQKGPGVKPNELATRLEKARELGGTRG